MFSSCRLKLDNKHIKGSTNISTVIHIVLTWPSDSWSQDYDDDWKASDNREEGTEMWIKRGKNVDMI